MRKIFFILFILISANATKATTYYWIGGLNSSSSFGNNKNWTIEATDVNSNGIRDTSLTSPLIIGTADVFIFDGTNLGNSFSTPLTGNVLVTTGSLATTPFAQLQILNSANINLTRSSAGAAIVPINGDGSSADDLVVDATSTLTVGSLIYNYDVGILLGASATGAISGNIYLSPLASAAAFIHGRNYITVAAANSLIFNTGSSCYITDSTTTSGFNSSVANSVVFKTGSNLYYYTGRSPIGTSSSVQVSTFEPGSNLYFRGSNIFYTDGVTAYGSSGWVNNKFLANVFIQNNATITADGTIYKMENLTIDAGCTLSCHTSGHVPVMGNLVVNGSLNLPVALSSNSLVLGGVSTPQTISGTGNINTPGLIIADNADVTLSLTGVNKFINTAVSNGGSTAIWGKLNFGIDNQIKGTSPITVKSASSVPATFTGTLTVGTYQITAVSNGAIPSLGATGSVGQSVSGTGISAGTVIMGSASSSTILNLSKPVTTSGIGVTISISNAAATLVTANPNGFDSTNANASIFISDNKSYQAGTNYVLNAATAKPFGISRGNANNFQSVGNVIVNAPITTNYGINVNGTLTLNSGNLTIRPTDTIRISATGTITGAPFSSSKYIITSISGNNIGALRIDSLTTARLFPIGSATNYLPITLTPSSKDTFLVNVYEGVTVDATPSGTAFNASQKASIVDVVWNINRVSTKTDACTIATNFVASLKGATFAAAPNNQIGLSRYDGSAWTTATGSGSNLANTATSNTYTTFGPFIASIQGTVLPVQLLYFNASASGNSVICNWETTAEYGIDKYSIQRSIDGITYLDISSVSAANNAVVTNAYNYRDANLLPATYFYRLAIVEKDGKKNYSKILRITLSSKVKIIAYPNPVLDVLTITGIEKGNKISIINTLGNVLLTQTASANTTSLHVENFPKGNYLVTIEANGNRISTIGFVK